MPGGRGEVEDPDGSEIHHICHSSATKDGADVLTSLYSTQGQREVEGGLLAPGTQEKTTRPWLHVGNKTKRLRRTTLFVLSWDANVQKKGAQISLCFRELKSINILLCRLH